MPRIIRVLMHYHAPDAHGPRHVYLGEARALRQDLELTIHEGRNHQVKRMCEAVGHRVRTLQRVRFGPLRIDDLPEGAHRRLKAAEVEGLRAM